MLGRITTEDGYTLRVFSSLYMDYGLEITKEGETLFYSPHFLCCDSYGYTPADQEQSEDYPGGIGSEEEDTPWTEKEWEECLKAEAWELLEACLPQEETNE